mgnify:FL=1
MKIATLVIMCNLNIVLVTVWRMDGETSVIGQMIDQLISDHEMCIRVSDPHTPTAACQADLQTTFVHPA